MKCTHVKLPGGTTAIVCSSGGARPRRCSACGRALSATLQCDWKLEGGKTCDAWICAGCAQEAGPDKHLCPTHQRTYMEWQAQRAAPPVSR